MAIEPKLRGLRNFESRIAAKLGVDVSGQVSATKTKDCSSKTVETCSRVLRKRGGDKPNSNAENDGNESDVKQSCEKRVKRTKLKNTEAGSVAKGPRVVPLASVTNKRDPDFTWPLQNTQLPHCAKKSPLAARSSSLFNIFKKPETPRRSSVENKIFVSGGEKPTSDAEATNKQAIYNDPNMTPLKRTSALPKEKKEELYEFECDENEPKPKKKHKPIMKIQRIRAVKRKKPKVYEADPETERRVLKNLDISPSLFEEFRSAKKQKVASSDNVGGQVPKSAQSRANVAEVEDIAIPSGSFDFDGGPMSSPCREYGQSTPMRADAPSMFMEDCQDKFGRLSAKVYSPVKSKDSPMRNEGPDVINESKDLGRPSGRLWSPVNSKDSPIPVLMAEYNKDPVRNDNDGPRSVASCASPASEYSIYHDDLDVSASTPVKCNKNNNCSTYSRRRRQPIELNISNCFGFDEPEVVEEPLVSPIKSSFHVPEPTAVAPPLRPIPIIKSKPPIMRPPPETPAVDVDQVIKQLRFEVGDSSANSANISVYDDSEINLKNKSPIKRYFQPKEDQKHIANKTSDESSLCDNDSISPIRVAPKVPRVSYERLNKLRNKKVIEPAYKELSGSESAEECEESDDEPEPAEEIFKPTKKNKAEVKHAPKKKEKGMTKKEEEDLEKWAQMFNSQCDQIDGFGLVVE